MPQAESERSYMVLLNDDKAPMEFVVEGMAECGIYSQIDAVQIVDQVVSLAREQGHPLQGVLEKYVP
jgi:ATP-dependent Clp protease adapter protein ClpS